MTSSIFEIVGFPKAHTQLKPNQKTIWPHQIFWQKSVFCWMCNTVLQKWGHTNCRLLMNKKLSGNSDSLRKWVLVVLKKEQSMYVSTFKRGFLPTCENVVECRLYIGWIQGGCFNEGELIGLCERFRFFGWNSPQVTEVRLVANQHDHDIWKNINIKVDFWLFNLFYRL